MQMNAFEVEQSYEIKNIIYFFAWIKLENIGAKKELWWNKLRGCWVHGQKQQEQPSQAVNCFRPNQKGRVGK